MSETKKMVLIVEDEDLVARMYQAGLAKNEKLDVQIARDGEEALILMEGIVPDLVILDIMMPKVNGMEVLERMKEDERLKNVPVVMLSNLSGEHDEELATQKGASDYWVKKDIPPREMESRIVKMLFG